MNLGRRIQISGPCEMHSRDYHSTTNTCVSLFCFHLDPPVHRILNNVLCNRLIGWSWEPMSTQPGSSYSSRWCLRLLWFNLDKSDKPVQYRLFHRSSLPWWFASSPPTSVWSYWWEEIAKSTHPKKHQVPKKKLFCTIDLSDVFFRSSLCSSAMYLSSWSGLEWSENQGMGLWVVFSFKTALICSIRQMISKKRKDSVGSKSTVRYWQTTKFRASQLG